MRGRICLAVLATALAAFGYLKSYEITPTQASWSGKVRGDDDYGIGNTFVANFDSICWCDVFIGHVGCATSHA